ncbi:curli production assembly/transport component CsgE [Vibrio diazotrophicus]|uniref:Curli production assembly/transport component CsgE n=1 Tax=Vibrio diazotrophicus TaxID=685 RepID=A0A329E9N5_VIBDI|nr:MULTISPECIES: CsgE family curli-type amyloid fiber assembly protein [Vibrio]MCF7362150.1 curli production assembly/transport protein CsgE [Vibrio sp. A1-b2]RAS62091.1 curli production assembly/transport component CsgE [Vibrio diazotrophicus]
MTLKINTFLIIFFVYFSLHASYLHAKESAGDQSPIEDSQQLEDGEHDSLDEVNGLIIDRTMTRIGNMFYSEFAQQLNESEENLKENLTITEKTTAKFGTIMTIWHSQKVVFRTSLSPKMKESKEQAAKAVRTVQDYLTKWRIQRMYSDTFDLAHDEI